MSAEWNEKLKRALMSENFGYAFDQLMEKTLPPNLSVCAYRPTPNDKFAFGILIQFTPANNYEESRSICFLGENGVMEEFEVDLQEVSGEDYVIIEDVNFFTDMDENLKVLDDKCTNLYQAAQSLERIMTDGNHVLEVL